MKFSWRWFGDKDNISLEKINQIPGLTGIVTAIYDQPAGTVWSIKKISKLVQRINNYNLELTAIESVPVPEEIKLGSPDRDSYIEVWKENLQNLSSLGIEVVCYNFMPAFDWFRTDLQKPLMDGSNSLFFSQKELNKKPLEDLVDLPGWDSNYSFNEVSSLINKYKELGEEGLWDNLEYFLKRVVPVAENYGIKLGIHPDDPPWEILGLPRIIKDKEALSRVVNIIDSKSNGLAICTGSLGANEKNSMPEILKYFSKKDKLNFVHLRNIKHFGDKEFQETAHYSSSGSLDMFEIMKILVETDYSGPIRPDHGRMIWNEKGRPGYGLYDRALGHSYILGLYEALTKGSGNYYG